MGELNAYYLQLLEVGLITLREAAHEGDLEWVGHAADLLHNVPSLVDESNVKRHEYFWFTEREHYMQWASEPGHEKALAQMRALYAPTWREMEPLVLELLQRENVRMTG